MGKTGGSIIMDVATAARRMLMVLRHLAKSPKRWQAWERIRYAIGFDGEPTIREEFSRLMESASVAGFVTSDYRPETAEDHRRYRITDKGAAIAKYMAIHEIG